MTYDRCLSCQSPTGNAWNEDESNRPRKSGKKPWRQKGTGRARAGYVASPIWRGGGVVFGPQPHDFSKNTPTKVKRLALRKAISERAKAGDLLLIDAIKLEKPNTKALVQLLLNAGVEGSALLVLEVHDENVYLSARNHLALDATTTAGQGECRGLSPL